MTCSRLVTFFSDHMAQEKQEESLTAEGSRNSYAPLRRQKKHACRG